MGTGKISVIIAAAGRGDRFGGGENKTFAKLDGRPIFLRSVEQFINRDDVCQTILVVSPADMEQMKSKYAPNLAFMGVTLVEGGERRIDSVAKGLEKVTDDADYVAVHDAARPCVSRAMIDDVFAEAQKSGAAILAAPLHGTIKRASGAGVIEVTVPRENLYEAQTPQVFRRQLLREAYEHRPQDTDEITDDAQLLENQGHPIAIVRSDASNLKITTKADIALGNAILKSRPPDKPVKPFGAFEEAQW